mgnify:CR=1 FL=1
MRVGTRQSGDGCGKQHRDHPHACGDKTLPALQAIRPRGSSPCVWGQEKIAQEHHVGSGIIPMRVGTSRQNAVSYRAD